MAVIRPYEDVKDISTTPLPGRSPERLFAEPGSFGPSVEPLTNDLSQASTTLQKVATSNEINDAAVKGAQLHASLTQMVQQRAVGEATDPNFSTNVMNDVQGQIAQYTSGYTTREGQAEANRYAAGITASIGDAAGKFSIAAAGQLQKQNAQNMIVANQTVLRANPNQYEAIRDQTAQTFQNDASHYGGLSVPEKLELTRYATDQYATAALDGIIKSSPNGPQQAQAALASGRFGALNEQQRYMLDSRIQTAINGQRIQAMQQEQQARLAAEDASNKAGLQIFKQFTDSLKPGGQPFDTTAITDNPAIRTWQDKNSMLDAVARITAMGADKQANANGGAYSTILSEIGNGNVKDVAALVPYLGRTDGPDLTARGFEQLAPLIVGKRDPDMAQETQFRTQLAKTLQTELAGTNPMTGARDPRGEELVGKALPMVDAAWAKGLDTLTGKGMSKQEAMGHLMDPDDPNYVLRSALALKRSPMEFYQDMLKSGNSVTNIPAPPTTAAYKDLAQVQADVAAKRLTRDQGAALARERGWIQ